MFSNCCLVSRGIFKSKQSIQVFKFNLKQLNGLGGWSNYEKKGREELKSVSSHCKPVCKWLCADVFVLRLLLLSLPGCSDTCIASAPSPEAALAVGSRCRQVWFNSCLYPAPGCGAKQKSPLSFS